MNNLVDVRPTLKTSLTNFINEIDLVFEYIDKSKVKALRKFLNKLNDSTYLDNFAKEICSKLEKYKEPISKIVISNGKIKSSNFDFLNELVLFDNILEFSSFKDENKNTKRTIVKYLHNVYMSCFVLQFGSKDNQQFIGNFIQEIAAATQQQKSNTNATTTNQTTTPTGSTTTTPTDGFQNIFQSLMSNKELVSIANDLTKDIQKENLDPMALLSSMMSGKPDPKITNLVNTITGKIEEKINNGDIDKKMLEDQANTLLSTVSSSGMPNLADLATGVAGLTNLDPTRDLE